MNAVSPARDASFRILQKVSRGGYASDLLRKEGTALDARDASLAESIVFGCLRYQSQLDYLISHFSGRPQLKLDEEVRIVLRIGIFQMRYLARIPAHAAVAESVELVKRARKRSAAGFVNAVLRKVNREPVPWPDRATELSIPAWMLERWERRYGMEQAALLAREALKEPEQFVNIETGRQQDIGAQSIVPLLRVEPGMRVLDLCAAPGNKTAQIIQALWGEAAGEETQLSEARWDGKPAGMVVACDRHLQRLENVPVESLRVALDATKPLPFSRQFDRILVDAPCSGTGTLRRNPEIKWRLKPEDLQEFHDRQCRILANAMELLASGGKLVYATCSLEAEENENVVEGYNVQESYIRLPGRDPGDGFFAAVLCR